MIKKEILTTLISICITTIAIIAAFYGGLIVYIGEGALNTKNDITNYYNTLNNYIYAFANLTEPDISDNNWYRQSQIDANIYYIFQNETWKNNPIEVLQTFINDIKDSYKKGKEDDEKIREWLDELNLNHFPANYNELINMDFHRFLNKLYIEFPPPPSKYSFLSRHIFIDKNTDYQKFIEWANKYERYNYGTTLSVMQISTEIREIIEIYKDYIKLLNKNVELLESLNQTALEWNIESNKNLIKYQGDMIDYYFRIFQKMDEINALVIKTKNSIYLYEDYRNIGFNNISNNVQYMVLTGVVIPFAILSFNKKIDDIITIFIKNDINKEYINNGIKIILFLDIIIFINFTKVMIDIIWNQLTLLYFT